MRPQVACPVRELEPGKIRLQILVCLQYALAQADVEIKRAHTAISPRIPAYSCSSVGGREVCLTKFACASGKALLHDGVAAGLAGSTVVGVDLA